MKIAFTGGGTGGHFYPIIAVAEAIHDIVVEEKMINPKLYFISPTPYDQKMLFDYGIIYKKVSTGKLRRYFSILNLFDFFRTGIGVLKALWTLFTIYPDIIFSKGGYGSFPVVLAGKILGIPIIIHESDSTPGKVNIWAGKFAKKIAVSYPEAAEHFPKEKVAWTGNPVRKKIKFVSNEGAAEYLNLESTIPTILILGGSQGSKIINDAIFEALPVLLEKYQIIHQVGVKNIKGILELKNTLLKDHQYIRRYKPYKYLNDLAMKMAAGAADVVISRAGSTIFEIANWHKPSIIIPITKSNDNHQLKNAYIYARTGAASVIEEKNIFDDILLIEIDRILNNEEIKNKMIEETKSFAKPEAANLIAKEIIKISNNH